MCCIIIMISMWWGTSSIIYSNYGQKKISGNEINFCPHNKISGSALKWFISKYGIELFNECINDILLNLLKNINEMLYILISSWFFHVFLDFCCFFFYLCEIATLQNHFLVLCSILNKFFFCK